MKVIRLDQVWALVFLIFPLLAAAAFFLSRLFFKKGVRISGVSAFEDSRSIRTVGYFATIAAILAGLFIIAFSLSKPQYGIRKEKIISEGIDIMIALDTSQSMLEHDFLQQTKIDVAKKIIADFIGMRKGDRIGLVTFATTSLLRCPATVNRELVQRVVRSVHINPQNENSWKTAIGIGLASAINRILSADPKHKVKSRVVILVTDGQNNAGEISPQAASEIAVQTAIRVYTVGIGNNDQIDPALLREIAEKSGGKFFQSINSGDLGKIFEEINRLEKTQIESFDFTRFRNIGYEYALFGILLMLAGLFLNILFFKRLS